MSKMSREIGREIERKRDDREREIEV